MHRRPGVQRRLRGWACLLGLMGCLAMGWVDAQGQVVPRQVLVKWREGPGGAGAGGVGLQAGGGGAGVALPAGARLGKTLALPGWRLVELPEGWAARNAVEWFRRRPEVVVAEPNYRYQLHAVPGDPYRGRLWGLERIGAPAAWARTTGSTNVVVAVLDTGVELSHPDLRANLWWNPDEVPGNGVDDDGDGVIDDVHGADFVDDDGDPTDDAGHGTHVSGTIGAEANNGHGVAGVCWRVGLLPVRVGRVDGFGDTTSLVAAFDYVVRLKRRGVDVRVINCSWGGGFPSAALKEAIAAAGEAGILIVCSAGNDHQDNDALPVYPAGYDCPEILSVAASAACDEPANFSNHGRTTVHLAAPGRDILSTYRTGERYGVLSGTSMAAPHVAGAAALLASYRTNLTVSQLRSLILATVNPVASWTNRVTSGGVLDVGRAMSMLAAGTLPGSSKPSVPAGRITAVSRLASGRWGNDNSGAASISADGRWVAFVSYATNLVAGDTEGFGDVFLRDLGSNVVVRVSQTPTGKGGDGDSGAPVLSADGRFVAFLSTSTNLAAHDSNHETDVFVWDRTTRRVELVSVRVDGVTAGNGASDGPSISADGSLVAFSSLASDLVTNDRNPSSDVFVRDRSRRVTERVSVTVGGAEVVGTSEAPSLSADGRYVAFHSGAAGLVAGDGNAAWDVFVRDRATGLVELASGRGSGGGFQAGNSDSVFPVISGDGRFVLFHTAANNFDALDGGWVGVFLRDRQTGDLVRVNARAGMAAGGDAFADGLSADGRYATFTTDDPTLGPGGVPGVYRAWVFDRLTSGIGELGRSEAGYGPDDNTMFGQPSGDGRYVVFASRASNGMPGHGNGLTDVFVEDRGVARPDLALRREGDPAYTGWGTLHPRTLQRVGRRLASGENAVFDLALANGGTSRAFSLHLTTPRSPDPAGWSYQVVDGRTGVALGAAMSGSGWLTPTIPAGSNLVLRLTLARGGGSVGEPRFAVQVSARSEAGGADLDAVVAVAETEAAPPGFVLVSRAASGVPADRHAEVPAVSGDGTRVAFSSDTVRFEERTDTNYSADVFLFDGEARTLRRVSDASEDDEANADSGYPALSGDGRRLAFQSRASNLVPFDSNGVDDVFVRDLESGVVRRVSLSADGKQGNRGSEGAILAAGGGQVAFTSAATNLTAGDANASEDAFLRDLESGAVECLSCTPAGVPANGDSSVVALTADGRYALVNSYADDFGPPDTNGFSDVYLFDRSTRTWELVSSGTNGAAGNGPSRGGSISDDGRWVTFQSQATDLVSGVVTVERQGYVLDRRAHRLSTLANFVPTLPDGLEARGALVSGDGARWAIAARRACGQGAEVDQVLVYDRSREQWIKVSATRGGAWGDDHSFIGRFSGNGRYLAFESAAGNLLGEPAPFAHQIYLADLAATGMDAMVRRSPEGPWRGEGQAEVQYQSVAGTVAGGVAFSREFGVAVRNAGTDPDRFLVRAPAMPVEMGTCRIQVLTEPPEEIAAAVLGDGWSTPWLRPGETLYFVVTLALGEAPEADYTLELEARSRTDGSRSERVWMTDRVDVDRDGLPDGWEVEWFGGVERTDGSVDTDGDGASDREEWLASTRPTEGGDVLRVGVEWDGLGGGPRLKWKAVPFVHYQLERGTVAGGFRRAGAEVVRGVAGEVTVEDGSAGAGGGADAVYRVRAEPP